MKHVKKAVVCLLILSMLLGVLPVGTLAADDAQSFRLGTLCGDMLAGGGISVTTPEGIFFADASREGALFCRTREAERLITADCGRYLNYDNGTLFYAVQQADGFTVWAHHSATGERTQCLTQSGTLSRMYTVNGTELYYQIQDSVWHCVLATGQKTCLFTAQKLWSFVPTARGLVYATGSLLDYAVYAGQTLLVEHADDYTYEADVDGGTIVYSVNGADRQIAARDAFSGITQARPFEGCGQLAVGETPEAPAAPEAAVSEAAQAPATRTVTGVARRTLSAGQANIVKRAMQMATIQWTPVSGTIPKWGGTAYFAAGTTYTGLPYGQPVYASYVPWSTGLTEFLTYVNDADSKMYTSTSTYNEPAPYYSNDCSAFVAWAWNLAARQTTGSLPNFATLVSSVSYANAQVGDCLNNANSHVVLITDMTYAADGTINGIRITEQTPPICKSTWYGTGYANSLSAFTTKYFGGGYSLYRSNTRDSATYTHCCAVPLDGDVCALCGAGAAADSKFGIDVSHWQGSIDWAAAAQDIDFAILRSSYGTSTMDTQWENNVRGCTENNIPFGVYVYGRATTVAQAQAEASSVISRLAGYQPTLPVFYDFEDAETLKTLSNAEILTLITAFCDAVQAAGYLPGVYANTSDWNTYLTDAAYDSWYRWVAQYSSACTYTGAYSIWQYSDAGSVSGISGDVDVDLWYGELPTAAHAHSYTAAVTSAADCTAAGILTYTCGCGACYTETIPATGHSYEATSVTLPTCTAYAAASLRCVTCGNTQSIRYESSYSDWSTQAPAGVPAALLESKTQYRYADTQTTTSYTPDLPGYTPVSSAWEQSAAGTVEYAVFPDGFDTAHSLYQTYHNTPVTASETATDKTVVTSDTVGAWLYYHWCRGSYSAGPINRKVMPYYVYTEGNATNSFVDFAAYRSTVNPAGITTNTIDTGSGVTASWGNDTAYFAPNGAVCADSYWYFAAPVHTLRYTAYRKLFTYQRTGAWSSWTDTETTATDTRQVETRTLYRFATAPTGHSYTAVTTAATCTAPEQVSYTCTRCQDRYSEYPNAVWSAWTTVQPSGGVREERTVSRYADYQTTTSYATSMSGCTQLSSVWESSGTGTVQYVEQWPAGFATTSGLYGTYANAPVTASETATEKTCIHSDAAAGWIYWHWCRGADSLALGYDRKISTEYTDEFASFDAFYSTTDPSTLPYTQSGSYYTYANGSCCGDTARYYALAVNTQSYESYRRLFTYGGYGAWSDWSTQSYTASEARQVQTRTEYRTLLNASYGEHQAVAAATIEATCTTVGSVGGASCALCGETLQSPTVLPPLGHALYYTAAVGQTHRVTCARCDYTQTQPHSFASGVCTLCGQKGGSCGASVYWYLRDTDGELVIDGSGEMEDYSAGTEPWFPLRNKIRHATVNSGVTRLGKLAFYATNIRGISLPDTVTQIGGYCFSSCRFLTSVELPQSVISIGRNAFVACTNLTSLTVCPQAVDLGATMLLFCTKLTVYGDSGSAIERYALNNAVPFVALQAAQHLHEFTNGLCSCGLYGGSCGAQLDWTLDADTGALTVSGSGAMEDYRAGGAPWYLHRGRIKTVTVEAGVTSLGKLAFYATNVRSLVLAQTVRELGGFCFSNCPQLTDVTLPEGVEQVGQNAFVLCTALQSLTVRNAALRFGKTMFLRAPNVTLYGAAGSTAEQYAAANNLPFAAIE